MVVLGQFNPDYKPELLPVDTELQLTIRKAEVKSSNKPGVNDRIFLILEDPGNPVAEEVLTNIWLPGPDDTPKQANRSMKRVTDLFMAAGLKAEGDLTTDDVTQLEGQQVWCILAVDNDQDGNETRKIKSFAV